MSTMNKNGKKKVSLKERLVRYYRENQTDIVAGCMLQSGNATAASMYRTFRK